LDNVVSQPYDKISDAMREDYYSKDDHNIVRIIKGRPGPDDSDQSNVYTRARSSLDEWLEQGILQRDEKPAFYVYHQEFEAPGIGRKTRKGFICSIRLTPFEAGVVLPHEKTLSKPKEDRLNLMRATRTNFGQIFMLYPDEKNEVYGMLEQFAGGPAEMEALEEGSVKHSVWTVNDPDVIDSVKEAMRDRVLFIADGHHRYETALDYLEEVKADDPSYTVDASCNYRMVTLVGMEDPGLYILPTHRLVHSLAGFDMDTFIGKAEEYFNVRGSDSLQKALDDMGGEKAGHAFGVYAPGRYWVLTSKQGSGWEKLLPTGRSEEWKKLDVVVLHQVVIQHLLGISEEKVTSQENIRYLRDPEDGLKAVDSGDAQLLLLVNATRISQVKAVASQMEKMPQKSTDFFPKLIAGLVMSPLT
jgi:uncharacterized protein (DUF1015 family)